MKCVGAHSLQELDDSLLLVWIHSGQLVQPKLQFSPRVLKHAAVLQHLKEMHNRVCLSWTVLLEHLRLIAVRKQTVTAVKGKATLLTLSTSSRVEVFRCLQLLLTNIWSSR